MIRRYSRIFGLPFFTFHLGSFRLHRIVRLRSQLERVKHERELWKEVVERRQQQPLQRFSCGSFSWYLGVSIKGRTQNGWFVMDNPIKIDDLGVPPFMEAYVFSSN